MSVCTCMCVWQGSFALLSISSIVLLFSFILVTYNTIRCIYVKKILKKNLYTFLGFSYFSNIKQFFSCKDKIFTLALSNVRYHDNNIHFYACIRLFYILCTVSTQSHETQ